jgi:peroxiredoxin
MPMKLKFFTIVFIVLVIILIGLSFNKKTLPPLNMITIEGQPITNQDLHGKVVLINFWATDCPGCINEMPELINTYNDFKQHGFEVLAVSMFYDPPSRVMSFSKNYPLPFPVIMDIKKDIIKNFEDVKLTPTSILINHKGEIINTIIGEIEFDSFRQSLKNLLKDASEHS